MPADGQPGARGEEDRRAGSISPGVPPPCDPTAPGYPQEYLWIGLRLHAVILGQDYIADGPGHQRAARRAAWADRRLLLGSV